MIEASTPGTGRGRIRSLCLVVVAVAAVSACSPGGQPSPALSIAASAPGPTGGLDPCSLVTRAEASIVLGVPVGEGRAKRVAGGGTCSYDAGKSRSVLVAVVTDKPSVIKARFEYTTSRPATRAAFRPVPGIGEGAIAGATKAKASLLFHQGGVLVSIILTVGDVSTGESLARVTKLGTSAAQRL